MKLFGPTFRGMRGAYCNLDLFAQLQDVQIDTSNPSQYLDPETCAQLVSAAANYLDADYVHGGYGDDRTVLWSGSYLENEKKFTHLGWDGNVPAHTALHAPFDMEIVAVGDDATTFGTHGWGRWCIARPSEDSGVERNRSIIFIFAHLGEVPSAGAAFNCDEVFATVGAPSTNGGWFPHVHVQVVDREEHAFFSVSNPERGNFDTFMDELDGYATASDFARDTDRVYLDPLRWIQ